MRSRVVLLLLAGCSAAPQDVKEGTVVDPSAPSGLTIASFAPGTFAGVVSLSAEGGCSQTHVGTSSRSGVAMTFVTDGGVRACRAMRHREVYVSAGTSGGASEYGVLEQQGFSGRYARRGAWLDVTLTADDAVCERKRAGTAADVRTWRLECLPVLLDRVTAPALLCRAPNDEVESPYEVGGVLKGDGDARWLPLAAGDGVETHAHDEWYVAFHTWMTQTKTASRPLRGDPWSWLAP